MKTEYGDRFQFIIDDFDQHGHPGFAKLFAEFEQFAEGFRCGWFKQFFEEEQMSLKYRQALVFLHELGDLPDDMLKTVKEALGETEDA